MADPEHLATLRNGIDVWNAWRSAHESVRPDFSGEAFDREDLRGADLRNANLADVRLNRSNLSGANLSRADLSRSNLSEANLSHADLADADLSRAILFWTDFRGADLRGALLNGAYLDGANFSDVRIGYTFLAEIDLSVVVGLEKVRHLAPSYLSIDAVYKSQGNITEVFLRKAGVPEDFITYMRSLTGKAIEFYTCFISFTEADDAFSKRLYNDLQAKGVRCWRWKEDAKWGKTLLHSIDEAVRVYDKLIVICSEQSLNAPAVIREIERALQKEDDLARQGKEGEVLFPIRLDDYIFTGWTHHRKADVIAKNVGDFRQWEQHAAYLKAFDRLLRDLKAEP